MRHSTDEELQNNIGTPTGVFPGYNGILIRTFMQGSTWSVFWQLPVKMMGSMNLSSWTKILM